MRRVLGPGGNSRDFWDWLAQLEAPGWRDEQHALEDMALAC